MSVTAYIDLIDKDRETMGWVKRIETITAGGPGITEQQAEVQAITVAEAIEIIGDHQMVVSMTETTIGQLLAQRARDELDRDTVTAEDLARYDAIDDNCRQLREELHAVLYVPGGHAGRPPAEQYAAIITDLGYRPKDWQPPADITSEQVAVLAADHGYWWDNTRGLRRPDRRGSTLTMHILMATDDLEVDAVAGRTSDGWHVRIVTIRDDVICETPWYEDTLTDVTISDLHILAGEALTV